MTLAEMIANEEKILAKAKYKLEYLRAAEFLQNLQDTAEVTLCEALAEYYGRETQKVFDAPDDIFSCSRATFIVKLKIGRYKSLAGTKNEPGWAAKALKCAKILDEYKGKY